MLSFILEHPLYLPFILVNIWIIYKAIQEFAYKPETDDSSDNDGGGSGPADPELDLPPGVTLPKEREEVLTD
jgi:hypothetical protein